ncbi:G5 domain-containing protein [Gemella sp. GH3]|nr:G5 domain-containing protein [Gemella sp. GH3.1]NYS50109.1 G5 domain-containing protein [Gemella sp. GH3]
MSKFKKIVVALSVTTVLSSGAYIANEEYNKVALAIHLDDNTIGVKVKKGTVRDILSSQGIELGNYDRVEPSADTHITKGETIRVYKARDIVIKDGDKVETRKTTYKKVEDILKELEIKLGENDKVTPDLTTEVGFVDTITITRVDKVQDVTKETIAFETVEEKDDSMYVGERAVVTSGKDGEKEIVKETVKENGNIVSESVVSENVTVEPVKEVVKVGTKERVGGAVASSYSGNNVNTQQYASYGGGSVVLSNGNTAGSVGSYAAQQMQARTGVSASTWEYIIARESNGQVNARNASGASGLFQTMPGWGSTATVEDQINAAVKAYNSQGLRAWGV